ncbi:Protein of unknown function DUF3245 [Dillenia turbinata]|uniref:Uncharacterized protein n=1 Tax=Dillenia turbinata TaxID=194707 RepID=A0AAN8Z488_9MAGN
MSVQDSSLPAKASPPKLVISNKGFQLAQKWVENMSKYSEEETSSLDFESRPPRLGLGAKHLRVREFRPSNDPLERKIQNKVKDAKRKAANVEDSTLPTNSHANDDDDDDAESRTKTFTKKRPMLVALSAPGKKLK